MARLQHLLQLARCDVAARDPCGEVGAPVGIGEGACGFLGGVDIGAARVEQAADTRVDAPCVRAGAFVGAAQRERLAGEIAVLRKARLDQFGKQRIARAAPPVGLRRCVHGGGNRGQRGGGRGALGRARAGGQGQCAGQRKSSRSKGRARGGGLAGVGHDAAIAKLLSKAIALAEKRRDARGLFDRPCRAWGPIAVYQGECPPRACAKTSEPSGSGSWG